MDRQRFLIPMLALITMWRLALLPTLELSPDEALALFYAKHPQGWYLEMGPLMPWLVKISTFIGGTGEQGVRWLAPVLALVASVCLWRLCRGVFDAVTATWTVVVLQVLPAFNIAALSMTSSIVSLTLLLGFVLALRMALHRHTVWDRMWWLAALCLLLALLADWRNGLAYVCAVAALALSRRRRHHLFSPGFVLVTVAVLLAGALFISWNVKMHWPSWEAGELEPGWSVWPNLLRWVLLASPVLLALLLWMLRSRSLGWRALTHDEALLLAVALPFALLDFGWGPRERWPHTGFLIWMALGIALLMQHNVSVLTLAIERKILLRSAALMLAGLQSMVLMRTDMLRSLGISWPLQKQVSSSHIYSYFLGADPSSSMMGWRQGTEVLAGILAAPAKPEQPAWFVIARHWPLAVMFDAYLPSEAKVFQPTPDHPRLQVLEQAEREHPFSVLPRYDVVNGGGSDYQGRHALYVSDDTSTAAPPSAIRRAFERWETLSVVRVMHAGQEVRTLKIFACYGYKPPDL